MTGLKRFDCRMQSPRGEEICQPDSDGAPQRLSWVEKTGGCRARDGPLAVNGLDSGVKRLPLLRGRRISLVHMMQVAFHQIGEPQRLAFARLLLNRPRFAILDEATSALDVASEERLYSRLACLPTAFISIGHRPSLRKFHKREIELSLASSPESKVRCNRDGIARRGPDSYTT